MHVVLHNFTNCKALKGAAISTTKHINVVDSIFESCKAKEEGGAIFRYQIEGDTKDMPVDEINSKYDKEASTFSNCTFNNNNSNQRGGAINILGDLNVQNCNFVSNKAVEGGAIFEVVRMNTAYEGPDSGKHDYFYNVKLTNSNFDGNCANLSGKTENNGGAICAVGGKIISDTNKFTNNEARHDGGAICQKLHVQYTLAPSNEIYNTDFSQNNVHNNGGAINLRGRADIENVKITDNYAQNNGGGVYFEKKDYCSDRGSSLKKTTIANNKCKNGRGAGTFIYKEVFLHEDLSIKDNFIENGEASDLRAVDLKDECISPEYGFYQGGSYVGLDLAGQSDVITDKKTKTSNPDWVSRINAAKNYLHMNDGRQIDTDSAGTWFWQKYWLKAC